MTKAAEILVGRAGELGEIANALGSLQHGPASLAILGEPGIGKTRLLAELTDVAGARGCTVLDGSASELEQDLPFWVFVDALDEYVAGLDPRIVASLPDEVRGELAQVLPCLSDAALDGGPVLQDERYRVHRAVRELLGRLAVSQPLVLVLDDVHWADAASVELLAALLRSPPDAPVLVVTAARPRQLPDRLSKAFERASRSAALTRLELGGLARDAAGALLGEAVGRERADAIYEEAGGNPFYLQQLARSAGAARGARPAIDGTALEAAGVPAAVVASLGEELELLSAATRTVLHGAAVAGDPFEPDLAAAAAGVDDLAAMAAFDELLELGLVRTTDVPRRFRFRHPLVRRAVYESAPGGWLLGAHERCAGVLAERGAPAAARAHHVEHAARHGDLEAVAVLEQAGSAATLRAPMSAARWFSAALRLAPATTPVERRLGLLSARARALAAGGRLAESHADLLECIALAPPEATGMRVQLTTACAGVERLLGHHADAHGRLLAGLDELADPAGADAIALMIELAIDSVFRADPEMACEWAGRASAAASALGNPALAAAAASMLTLAHAVAGHHAEAQAAHTETSALIASMSDDVLGERIDAVAYLASAGTYLDRYDDATAHAERALRIGRAAGRLHPMLLPALGAAHLMRGRLDDAASVLDDGVEAARLSGVTQSMAWMLRNRALVSIAAGDPRAALEMAEEALELTRTVDESVLLAWAAMVVASAAQLAGHDQRTIEVVGDPAGREALRMVPGVWRGIGLEVLTLAYLELDRADEAADAVAEAQAHAEAVGMPLASVWARRAAAALAMHAGDPGAAAEHALASAAAADEAGAAVQAAQSRMAAGRALAQAGQADLAGAEFERAAAAFQAAGALPHRDAAEQALRGLGRQVYRRSRPGQGDGLAGLTERERQIAELVVDRKTNAEIAGELFLSIKTVETHLRNVFRKLGVPSRVELARAIERAAARPEPPPRRRS